MGLPPALERDFESALSIPMTGRRLEQLLGPLQAYGEALYRWAGAMSLVARGDRDYLATRHFVPALRVAPLLAALPCREVVDIGSGAGLPGIPLALSLPDSRFWLVESRRRRASFLRHMVRVVGLANVTVVLSRFESWRPPSAADCLVTRAVRLTPELLHAAARVLAPHGALLALGVEPGRLRAAPALLWSPGQPQRGAAVTALMRPPGGTTAGPGRSALGGPG
jgi:16S rRNA (guanine527-N7)-methyltransferase